MTTERFFVGLGHPRCGTGFTASLLEQAGLDIGHERIRRDGIVSWCAASQAAKVPWGDPLGPLKPEHALFCVARSPRAALPSIVPETMRPRTYRFMARTLNQHHGAEIMPDIAADGLLKAALSYCHWFDLCLSHKPDLIYRVDVAADDSLLSDFIGRKLARNDDIGRNHKQRHVKPELSDEDYRALPAQLLHKLGDISDRLGYPAEGASFVSLTAR